MPGFNHFDECDCGWCAGGNGGASGWGAGTAASTLTWTTYSVPSAWVHPNANCPVCGATVFFYSNEHGSRVYFDELGPPWPKHPCTDGSSITTSGRRTVPVLPDPDYFRGRLESNSGRANSPVGLWIVGSVSKGSHGYFVKLRHPSSASANYERWCLDPIEAHSGDPVFIEGKIMSYFNWQKFRPGQVRLWPPNWGTR